MSNWVKKYYSVLKMSWIQTLEYRANAVVGAFAILSGLLIEYLLLSKVFADEIASNSPIQSFASFNHAVETCRKLTSKMLHVIQKFSTFLYVYSFR